MTVKCRAAAAIALGGLVALIATGCSVDANRAKREYLASGDRFFDQKKYAEAIVQYRNALQQDPKFGAARYKLAQAHEQLGDVQNAYREYVRAADSLPDDAEVQLKAGTYLLLTGQFDEARLRASKVLEKDPKNVNAQIMLGDALARLKNFDQALKELETAVKLDPKSSAGYTTLGTVQAATGNKADAEAAFRRAVEAEPKNPIAHMALGSFLWSAGRPADAEASFKQALSLDPNNAFARRALVTFYMANKRAPEAEPHLKALADADRSSSASQKLALADYYLMVNRSDDAMQVLDEVARGKGGYSAAKTRVAIVDYERKGAAEGNRVIDDVLTRDPKNVPARLTKSQFLVREGKLDDALKQAQAAVAVDPESIQAHYLCATIYRKMNRFDEAIKSFNEVIRLNPRAVAAQVQLSQLSLVEGSRNSALQLAQDAAKTLPGDPLVQLTLINGLLANHDVAGADTAVKTLLAKYPDTAPVLVAAAKVAMAKGDLKASRAAFERAERSDPKSFDALSGLVTLDLAEDHVDAARTRVDHRLAATPRDSRVLVLAAVVSSRGGDSKKTENFLRAAVDADATTLEPYLMLAQLYAVQKRLPEARANLEAVAAKRPNAIGAPTMIGMLYEAEGKTAEARARYERVLKIDPGAAVAANNLAYLYAENGGNLDLALQLAQTAKQKLPDAPEVADTLGWIYTKKDLATLAVAQLEAAAAKAPNNAIIQYHLGVALVKTGDRVKGRVALERALQLNLKPAAAAEARKLVAQVQS